MKCIKCGFENEEEVNFCLECGEKLYAECPGCGKILQLTAKFCNSCGQELGDPFNIKKILIQPEKKRRHITVLFSDLSSYTTILERTDPEEIKEITHKIFNEVSDIVSRYDGFIENYAGDGIMALFGIPNAHEDDPVRAIKAAREIHQIPASLKSEMLDKIGKPLSMHSGINSGLVVTEETGMEGGSHGVTGDAVNVASRLCSLAKPGEILVDANTFDQSEGLFEFATIGLTEIKGREKPVKIYKVLAQREKPLTIHRISGLRAEMVGRKAELFELQEATQILKKGKGRIFSICGDAGTGKSRLIEEFKTSLDLDEFQWLEGHAYSYSQNIPYYPLIDLLSRILLIQEDDPPDKIRDKVEKGLKRLVGESLDLIPYIGSLYSLNYPETENVSPEFWKSHLQESIRTILESLTKEAPTILHIEDLHWADPSFIELLRLLCHNFRQPAIFLFTYRPSFMLFSGNELNSIGGIYQEIILKDLSLSDAHNMLESLLRTKKIPSELSHLIQIKAEGNPFYLEELVNSLIESGILTKNMGDWKITKQLTESDISSSINMLITGRVDRLEKDTKHILQEASVIGRNFLYKILVKITSLENVMEKGLNTLERLDMIRTRILLPDLEYVFKHPLTQEVVYNGLLKKDRKEIHENIGRVMEILFKDRLPEFYETLAFHFKRGHSIYKAIDYLVRSGEKSLARYAVQESHQYFIEAFELLSNKTNRTKDEDALLIDVLTKWSLVYYFRGDALEHSKLLKKHIKIAESLDDKTRLGMYYNWYGWSIWFREKYSESYTYLKKALALGEELQDQNIIGYACTWLAWTCAELGNLDEAILYGEKAKAVSKNISSDQYLFFKALGAVGYASFYKGDRERTLESGKELLDFGQKHSNIRCMVMGHFMISFNYIIAGDKLAAIEAGKKAVQTAQDPLYCMYSRFLLGIAYILNGQWKEAEEVLHETFSNSRRLGCELIGTPVQAFLGLISIINGQPENGLEIMKDALELEIKSKRRYWYATIANSLGQVYLQLSDNDSSAAKKAMDYFNTALEVAEEIGANGVKAQVFLNLSFLHQIKKESDRASDYFSRAVSIFEEYKCYGHLEQVKVSS